MARQSACFYEALAAADALRIINDIVRASGHDDDKYLALSLACYNFSLDEEIFRHILDRAKERPRRALAICKAVCDGPLPNAVNLAAAALALVATPELLYRAGKQWPDPEYLATLSKALGGDLQPSPLHADLICRALAFQDIADALGYLRSAGRDWADGFDFGLLRQRLLASGDPKSLYLIGRDWPDGRFSDEVREALVKSGVAKYFWLAGRDWPDGRYTDDILQALIRTRNPKYLYLAGRDWPAGRVSDTLAEALREIGDAYWMEQAKASWRALSFS